GAGRTRARFRDGAPPGVRHGRRRGGLQAQPGPAPAAGDRTGLLQGSPLIILDEATSSLDTASELQVQAALAKLLDGRTAFVIAHRLGTIVEADLIVVMDSGRIVQASTHAALLA